MRQAYLDHPSSRASGIDSGLARQGKSSGVQGQVGAVGKGCLLFDILGNGFGVVVGALLANEYVPLIHV